VYTLVAFIGFTLVLTALPMVEIYSRVQNLKLTLLLLPQAIPLSIPIALALGIVCGVRGPRVTGRGIRRVLLLAIVGTLLALAAMLVIPDANQAFRVAMAEELGLRGITKYSLPRGMNELPLSELSNKSREYEESGFPERARGFRRAYYIRFALPAATFVLSLLALAIGSLLQSRVLRVAAIVIALGLYWAMLAAGGRSTSLPAAFSTWAPDIAFAAISLGLLKLLRERQSCVTE
jgi:lipopolysaccharide export LptBFGC system permease protein LptF